MKSRNTKIDNSKGLNGVVGLSNYLNDKDHINHKESAEKGDIQVLHRIQSIDRELFKDKSFKNQGLELMLPIPTCFDKLEQQEKYVKDFISFYKSQLGINPSQMEVVIHNHSIPNKNYKNYHAHIVILDQKITNNEKGRTRYYKMVGDKKVRCSKKESQFSIDERQVHLGNRFQVNKSFRINNEDFFVRDLTSKSIVRVNTYLEQEFIKSYPLKDLIENKRIKNLSKYKYLNIGKTIQVNSKSSYKAYLRLYNQVFRKEYNNLLKTHNINLKNANNNSDKIYIEEHAFLNRVNDLVNRANKSLLADERFIGKKINPIKLNLKRLMRNQKIKKVKTKPKEKEKSLNIKL